MPYAVAVTLCGHNNTEYGGFFDKAALLDAVMTSWSDLLTEIKQHIS